MRKELETLARKGQKRISLQPSSPEFIDEMQGLTEDMRRRMRQGLDGAFAELNRVAEPFD